MPVTWRSRQSVITFEGRSGEVSALAGDYAHSELSGISGSGEVHLSSAEHGIIYTHINDIDIHREINDAGTDTIDLWSASKISGEIAAHVGGEGGAVDSVFSRTGVVTAQANDYTHAQLASIAGSGEVHLSVAEHGDFLTNTLWRHEESHTLESHSDMGVDTPVVNDVVKFDGTNWVFCPYTTDLTFDILTLDDGISATQLIGASTAWKAIAAITFTATYQNGPPATAAINITAAQGWQTTSGWTSNQLVMDSPFASKATEEATNYPAMPAGTGTSVVTFTLSTTGGVDSKTHTVSFLNTILYGSSATARGAHNQASLAALSTLGANEGNTTTWTITPGAAEYVVFAYPDRLADITQVRCGSISAAFHATDTTLAPDVTEVVSFTNANGYTENFRVITSSLQNLDGLVGSTSFETLISAAAMNHQEWGATTKNTTFADGDLQTGDWQSGTSSPTASNTYLRTVAITVAGAGEYMVYAHPDRNGTIAQFQLGGITAAFNPADATAMTPAYETVAITNRAGYKENYKIYASKLANLSAFSSSLVSTSSSTKLNWLFWGELNIDSGDADGTATYTEANVEDNVATQPGKVASNSISSRSMTVNCAAGEYVYIAYPSRLGLLTNIVIGGLESIGDFWKDHTSGSELAITNEAGFQENYYVYVSKNPSFTNPTTMTVSL